MKLTIIAKIRETRTRFVQPSLRAASVYFVLGGTGPAAKIFHRGIIICFSSYESLKINKLLGKSSSSVHVN